MPAGLGFMVQAILGIMGYQSLLHLVHDSVRLIEVSLYDYGIKTFLNTY